MQIRRLASSLFIAMCVPPKPPSAVAARTLRRDVPLVKKQIGTMEVTEVCAGTMTWGSFVEKEESAHKELDTFVAAERDRLDKVWKASKSCKHVRAHMSSSLTHPSVLCDSHCNPQVLQ